MLKSQEYAAIFRAAQKGAMQTYMTEGMGSTGDYRHIARAMAGAYGGIADMFDKIAEAENSNSTSVQEGEK